MKLTDNRLKALEQRRRPSASPSGCVVIIDPATGVPVPGHEADPHATVIFVLPKKEAQPDPGPSPVKEITDDGAEWDDPRQAGI